MKPLIPYLILVASFLFAGAKSPSIAAVAPCEQVIGGLEAEYVKQGRVMAFAKELMPGVAMAIYIDPATETQYAILVVFPGAPTPSQDSIFQPYSVCSMAEQGIARVY